MPNRRASTIRVAALAWVLLLTSVPQSLLATDGVARLVDEPSARRIVLLVGSPRGIDAEASSDASQPLAVAMPRATLIYRLTSEVRAADGRMLELGEGWSVTIMDAEHVVARLGAHQASLEIPRPYGIAVQAGDTLQVLAELPIGASVHVYMQYESPSEAASRLPVSAGTLGMEASLGEHEFHFAWRASRSGRLVAVMGAALAGAATVELREVDSDRVIWRTRASAAFGSVAQAEDIVRLGVRLVEGRTYRLIVRRTADSPFAGGVLTPMAMLVPSL